MIVDDIIWKQRMSLGIFLKWKKFFYSQKQTPVDSKEECSQFQVAILILRQKALKNLLIHRENFLIINNLAYDDRRLFSFLRCAATQINHKCMKCGEQNHPRTFCSNSIIKISKIFFKNPKNVEKWQQIRKEKI